MNQANTSAHTRSVVAFFDTHDAAQRAVDKLVQAGFPRTDINIVEGASRTGMTGGTMASATDTGTGFWESLKDLFLPEEDRYSYAEGLRRGGYVVSVRTTEARYGQVVGVLDDEGSIDMDERETSWRQEGWTGYQAGSRPTGTAGGATAAAAGLTGAATAPESARASTSGTDRAAATIAAGREETIPIVEEQLRVGKRMVEQGRVRIRSYVVETPVREQVNLRQEHVQVERRPVNRPVSAADEALFRERTIEAEERAEQAVVSKEARVKEELVITKNAEERTQTVQDTVRHTEVEIEDDRTTGPGTVHQPDRAKPRQ